MNDEMKFTEEELESMADKLLEQASNSDIASQDETELPKPHKHAAKKKNPAEPAKTPEQVLQELLEKGKKSGRLAVKDLAVLEDLNLDSEVQNKFYETLEQALWDRGFSKNHARLVPHITIGRSIRGDEGFTCPRNEAFTADSMILYESRNVKGSMEYTPVHKESFLT